MEIPTISVEIDVLPHWEGLTLEQLFKEEWQAPKKLVHDLRMRKAVSMNGMVFDWRVPLKANEKIHIKLLKEPNQLICAPASTLEVLFEDEHLLVVNKPAGITTHPNDPDENDTLANRVASYMESKQYNEKVRHIHRLDQDTSGVVLFAKHALSHAILDRMLNDRNISRTYVALADGLITQSQQVIQKPIGRDRHHPTKRRVSQTGQRAVTYMNVIQTFPKENLTLVECKLETGRTHQIRVHASEIGHPLAGDSLYGGSNLFPRQALHARTLSFIHPFTGITINVQAPYMQDENIFLLHVKG